MDEQFVAVDVSGDGEVTAYDAALTAQASVELISLTAEQTKAADVNGDSEVTAYDAALIAQRAVGLISKVSSGAIGTVPEEVYRGKGGTSSISAQFLITYGAPLPETPFISRILSEGFCLKPRGAVCYRLD